MSGPGAYSREATLTPAERRVEASLPEPPHAGPSERPKVRYRIPPEARRLFRRAPWENLATAAIAVGVVMLMQPFSFAAYGWSFAVILAGTAGFVIASHLPE